MLVCEENSFTWNPAVDECFEVDVHAYGLVFIIQKGKCEWSNEPMWMVILTLKERVRNIKNIEEVITSDDLHDNLEDAIQSTVGRVRNYHVGRQSAALDYFTLKGEYPPPHLHHPDFIRFEREGWPGLV